MRRAFLVAFSGVLATLSVVASAAANPQGSFTQVAGDWTRSPPADRAACLRLVGANGTYTDLLKCVEMRLDARRSRERDARNPSFEG
jgi:hypothetical protein